MSLAPGTTFDRYEITSLLGSGGMGEVYLARDLRLERKVAIKILPSGFTRDTSRIQRFKQEAKAVSSLNHPNIITIHEVGEAGLESDGEMALRHFIATEFVDGKTLREIISSRNISVLASLDIGAQIASALSAAHEAGIVHRDIKPENVMIRRDSIVKVLDFGLAKLTERNEGPVDPDAPTAARLDTDPGTVLGTATYMSPEQVRGMRVDARSDIFSLGIVLYEMISGQMPFKGETPADVMSQVLNHTPPALTSLATVPLELHRIVGKALNKNRDERYQNIKDLLIDIKSLKRELEVTTTLAHSGRSSGESAQPVSYETTVNPTPSGNSSPTEELPAYRTVSSAEYIVNQLSRHKFRILVAIATLIVIGLAISKFTDRSHSIESIAILPFATVNANNEAQILSDLITDSIINNLSQISNLKVIARSAVIKFRGYETDISEVSRQLDVHAILTGRILQRGEDLSVSVALVDARDNRHLWGEQYNRKVTDLLLIQQDISRDVSDKLLLKISGEEKRRIDASSLYLKGRNAWNKRTAESIREGLGYFEQAIRVDPTYAPAYAGLADCYNMLVNYSIMPGREAFPKAKEAAQKALELDPALAEAHAAMAFTYFQWDWNWAEAEREFNRAIELKPNYGPAHQWFSSLLIVTGRTDEAISEARRAQDIDPFSSIVASHLAWISYLSRHDDQTIMVAQRTLKTDPNSFPAHRYLALGYLNQGKFGQAVAEFEKAVQMSRGSVMLKAELGHSLALAGRKNDAQQILDELIQISSSNHVSPYHLALISLGLGDSDKTIEFLKKAMDERAERLVWLSVDPRFDKLRSDHRFNDILQLIGLRTVSPIK